MSEENESTSLVVVDPGEVAAAPAAHQQAANDEEVVRLWIRSKNSVLSRAAYLRDWSRFRMFRKIPLNKIGIAELQDYADHLAERELSDASIRRMIGSVKSLLTFAHRIGWIAFNPGAAVALPSTHSKATKRILSEEQIFRLVAACDSKRDSLILKLFYLTGARRAELQAAKWRDIEARPKVNESDREIGQITLLGKGSKQRTVLIPATTWAALNDYRRESDKAEDYIFKNNQGEPLDSTTYWRIVRKAGKAIELPHISPHWLRHSHASHALDRKCSLQLISETLGHSSIMATSVYLHGRPDDSSSLYLAVD